MKQKIKWVWLVFVVLAMAGCVTTPRQMTAVSLVDELCAKDGGTKVYETVTLPKERFNEWGQFTGMSIGKEQIPTSEYYLVMEDKKISPYQSGEFGGLLITRYYGAVYRRNDNKLLGESISYHRSGGDILAIDAPSGYECPSRNKLEIEAAIFLKSNNLGK